VGNIKLVSSKGKKGGKKRKRRTAAKTAFTILIVLLVGIAALTLSLGFYVKNLDVVYPNVWADGVKLSDMTLDEAKTALIDGGYERNAEDVAATVNFPDGSSFTISGDEAGFSRSAADAAKAAFDFGRGGTLFENEVAFVKAYLNKTDLRDLSKAGFNEQYVRDVVAKYTKAFNATLIDAAYQVEKDSIVIVKGTGIEPADEQGVYDLTVATLSKAMDARGSQSADYTPQTKAEKDVDLSVLYSSINVEPISSEYDPETMEATESKPGITFDLPAAQAMLDKAVTGEKVVIPLVTVEPAVTKDQIDSLLFRDVLSETTTDIAGTSNRLNNITLAAAAINGTVLKPGDVFSFNGIVGQRTAEKGYKEAGAYVGGRTVQEIGGGICQVSSTTYNCVLYANLEVVERRAHGFTVAYLPLGNDATVDWGSIDFKFRNSTDYPIRVETAIDGRKLTVRLIGTKLDDNYIKIDHEDISTTPFKVVTKEDESVPAGQTIVDTSGYTGHVVDTYKYLYDGQDNLISKTLVGRSTYNTQDRVILVPVGSLTESPSPSPDASPSPGGSDTTSPPTEQPATPPAESPSPSPESPPSTDGSDAASPPTEQPATPPESPSPSPDASPSPGGSDTTSPPATPPAESGTPEASASPSALPDDPNESAPGYTEGMG